MCVYTLCMFGFFVFFQVNFFFFSYLSGTCWATKAKEEREKKALTKGTEHTKWTAQQQQPKKEWDGEKRKMKVSMVNCETKKEKLFRVHIEREWVIKTKRQTDSEEDKHNNIKHQRVIIPISGYVKVQMKPLIIFAISRARLWKGDSSSSQDLWVLKIFLLLLNGYTYLCKRVLVGFWLIAFTSKGFLHGNQFMLLNPVPPKETVNLFLTKWMKQTKQTRSDTIDKSQIDLLPRGFFHFLFSLRIIDFIKCVYFVMDVKETRSVSIGGWMSGKTLSLFSSIVRKRVV